MKNLKKVLSVTAAAAMVMTTVAPVSVFADDATFKIGGIGPVTGAAAIYGQAVKNATELAINEVRLGNEHSGWYCYFYTLCSCSKRDSSRQHVPVNSIRISNRVCCKPKRIPCMLL